MKTYWHATDAKNYDGIIQNGLLPKNIEHAVYLAETEKDAFKLVALRGYESVIIIKVKILKKDLDKIQESFDHSYNFFKCRAFMFHGSIPQSSIMNINWYDTSNIFKNIK